MTMIMANPKPPRKKVIPHNQPSFSVFHADPTFVKKIQSRDSSSGDGLEATPDSFRAPARVPFQWESRPGEPINPPEKIIESPCPSSRSDDADSPKSSSSLAPHAAVGPASSRARVCRFLKKLVDSGGKRDGDQHHDQLCGSSPTSTSSRGSSKMQGFSWGCIKSGF